MQPTRTRFAALAKWVIAALAVAGVGAVALALLMLVGFGGGSV